MDKKVTRKFLFEWGSRDRWAISGGFALSSWLDGAAAIYIAVARYILRPAWRDYGAGHRCERNTETPRQITERQFGPVPCEYIFPRYVPISYGLDFHRYLCDVLDREIGKKEKELTKRRLSRKRRAWKRKSLLVRNSQEESVVARFSRPEIGWS